MCWVREGVCACSTTAGVNPPCCSSPSQRLQTQQPHLCCRQPHLGNHRGAAAAFIWQLRARSDRCREQPGGVTSGGERAWQASDERRGKGSGPKKTTASSGCLAYRLARRCCAASAASLVARAALHARERPRPPRHAGQLGRPAVRLRPPRSPHLARRPVLARRQPVCSALTPTGIETGIVTRACSSPGEPQAIIGL